jgi:polysaccharide deacetylase family protein (PEP-CTERM system associated)
MTESRPPFVFSVDVECWGQSVLDRSLPILAHSASNVRRILDLLADAGGARATFFVLGKFAERHPDVVSELSRAGHEVASHGYGHVEVWRQSMEEFRADLRRASDIIAGIVGNRPIGYRAPVFSIGRDNLEALRVLAEEGYAYDSSIYPFAGPRYGIGDWPVDACRVTWPDGTTIVEYPLTVLKMAGRRVPISGGGYARLLPASVLWRSFRHAARRRQTPPAFYCHPYEIDPRELGRCYPQLPLKRRLHQGLGRTGFAGKLRSMLKRFEACAFSQVLVRTAEWSCRADGAEEASLLLGDSAMILSLLTAEMRAPRAARIERCDYGSSSSSSCGPGTSMYSRQLGHSATVPASLAANETA